MAEESTSGIQYLKFALSGHNRFVTGIAMLAALGGFLFGYDTGIIGQALPYIQKDLHPGTVASSWIVAAILIGAVVGAALPATSRTRSAASGPSACPDACTSSGRSPQRSPRT